MRRKGWIDEGRPKPSMEDEDADIEEPLPATPNPGSEHSADKIMHAGVTLTGPFLRPSANQNDQNEVNGPLSNNQPSLPDGSPGQHNREQPDEDELDALFAEELTDFGNTNEIAPKLGPHKMPVEDLFDDDEDAMRDMDEMW